eukprot:193383-Hanusia_phi.AAC.1
MTRTVTGARRLVADSDSSTVRVGSSDPGPTRATAAVRPSCRAAPQKTAALAAALTRNREQCPGDRACAA